MRVGRRLTVVSAKLTAHARIDAQPKARASIQEHLSVREWRLLDCSETRWHGRSTLRAVRCGNQTIGVACPFVIERQSTPSRGISTHARLERWGAMASNRCEHGRSALARGSVARWLRRNTPQVVYYGHRANSVACPFVIERQSNTPARLQKASPHGEQQMRTRSPRACV